MNYEERALKEALRWSRSIEKRSSILQRSTKKWQTSVNDKIPESVHRVVTSSVQKMIELAMTSSEYIRPVEVSSEWSFEERELLIKKRLKEYQRAASIEGAGTGLGGLWFGVADFPLLLSIKMKFLFDAAQIYGFNVHKYEERVYLLYVFMLAFSSDHTRKRVKELVLNWSEVEKQQKQIDWKTLQIEYRDSIDFVKMLQLVPGFGAVVGYFANRNLMHQLGETTLNTSRLRLLQSS
ncbi:EcsC family protein [Halobacillus yeomjeoni]|uniref:EcsC family protein n=1 Tax=Halobacillus yeomjeoni TaxID=311194 RepID=A0A931MTU2_9BACI|nr:EcsC family protein [Halobacillus yeomjeoni]MBH0228719.1 EcsC family protein [Halobacillus yeomjeoni]